MQLFLPNKYNELKEYFHGDLVFEMWPSTTVFSAETFLNMKFNNTLAECFRRKSAKLITLVKFQYVFPSESRFQ